MLSNDDKERIGQAWQRGFTRASFGGGRGTCQLTGRRDGFVALYLYDDKDSMLVDDRDAATSYLFSIAAYKALKQELDQQFPGINELKEKLHRKPTKQFGKRPRYRYPSSSIN